MRRRDQTAPLSVRCSNQQTTGTSYLVTTASGHPPRDFCQLTNERSTAQNNPTSDNIKLRRVQFTNEDDRMKMKSRQNFDIQPLVAAHDGETIIAEDEEDYMNNRNDYLWGSVAEESILICDLQPKRG